MPLVKIQDVSDNKFDYVIAGGGTAGLTLAARLTEDPNTSVLVLEAGLANLKEDLLLRPFQLGHQFGNPKFDWDYKTVPQKHADGTQVGLHSGKGLGGSSGINFQCWTKPPKEDIDDLERLGNPGWNWATHEKYINRAEKFTHVPKDVQALRSLDLDSWTTGTAGPLGTSHVKTTLDIEIKAQESLKALGLKDAKAPLSGDPNGVFFIPNTVDNTTFTRTYSMNAYFLPNHERPNFNVLVEANVRKVIVDGDAGGDLVAKGVEFSYEDKVYTVNATKEVILAAGSLKSPHILEQSGIGSKSILEPLGITVKLDLPGVGENYQEHTNAGVSYEIPDDVAADTWDLFFVPGVAVKQIELHAKGEGMFTQGVTGVSFSPLSKITDRADAIQHAIKTKIEQNLEKYRPGLQELYKVQLDRIARGAPHMETIVTPGLLSFPNPPTPGKRYVTFVTAVNHPFSRGTVHSVSSDPSVAPAYDPNYFSEEIDLESYVEIIKFARKAMNTSPMKELLGGKPKELNPGPDLTTDDQLKSWLKKVLGSTYHPLGTCAMLPREKEGVVDPKLKVYGTKNLRVVDLSIMPLHFAAHSQASVYGIAEQAADIIKGVI